MPRPTRRTPLPLRFGALLAALALVASACSTNGDDGGRATDRSPAFPQAADPGDPDGLVPLDTGPGLEWERIEHPGFALRFVVWSSTQFATVNTRADGRTELLTSPDGRTWTDAGRTFDDIEVRDLAVSRSALAVWGETLDSMGDPDQPDPLGNIASIHFSPDNGATWHQREIRHPDLAPSADNPGSQIVTAAFRGETLLVSAYFRSTDEAMLLRLDLGDDQPTFTPVALDPPATFIGDITVTASGIIMLGADETSSRLYIESANGFDRIEPDTRIATLLSDGQILYANEWESYELLISRDLGRTWTPVEEEVGSFSQTFVGPLGMAGTNTIGSTQPWAVTPDDGPPQLGTMPPGRTRAETYVSWSTDGAAWHHETATAAFGFPAFAYLAIGDAAVLAVVTPLSGEPYEEGAVPAELYLAVP